MSFLPLIAAVAFAGIAALGILAARFVCADVIPAEDGPQTSTIPVRALVIGSAVLGAVAAARGLSLGSLGFIGLACGLLVAIWASDVSSGIIPDVFTIFPLAAIYVASGLAVAVNKFPGGPWGLFDLALATLVPVIPFAFVAWRSRGMNLGWGDVKLAALGGPLIGLQGALLAFSIGCAAAVLVARVRGKGNAPVAFGPYLAAAIALPLAVISKSH